MANSSIAIRRHAIFKRHYRRAVAATPGFHDLELGAQWRLLRDHISVDPGPDAARLLERVGMEREGVLRRWSMHPNISAEPRDSFCYAIVKD